MVLAALILMVAMRAHAQGPPPPAPPADYPPPPAGYSPAPQLPPPPIVVGPPPPPPLSPAARVIYAPFYLGGLVLRYGVYYLFVAPLEIFARALTFGVDGGVDPDSP